MKKGKVYKMSQAMFIALAIKDKAGENAAMRVNKGIPLLPSDVRLYKPIVLKIVNKSFGLRHKIEDIFFTS